MKLQYEIITENHQDLSKIRHLYLTAFPEDERAPFDSLIQRAKKPNIDFVAFYDEKQFCGFTYLIKEEHLLYIFYFAVDDHLRNKGYGSMIINYLKEIYKDYSIFLEIEVLNPTEANYAQRKRRKDFYIRNEFRESGYGYTFGVEYEVMIYGNGHQPKLWHDLFYHFSDGYVDVEFIKMEEKNENSCH